MKSLKGISALFVASLLLAGCGPTTTRVSGKVSLRGKPLALGTVMLVDSTGLPKYGQIGAEGVYQVDDVRPGPVKATVSSPPPPGSPAAKAAARGRGETGVKAEERGEAPPAQPAGAGGWFAIPDKYADPATSELMFEVKAGQPLDIDLK